jgi:predicted small metal-binding protein
MKTMTCKQLGGPCDLEFHANSFEEMAEQSKNHGMEMFQKGDAAHIKVMNEMKEKMKSQTPDDTKAWFEKKRNEFDGLPETNKKAV